MQFTEIKRIVYLYGTKDNTYSLNYINPNTLQEIYLDVSGFRPNLKNYLEYSKNYKAVFYYIENDDLKYIVIGDNKFIYTR
jgi:hypothetical protein